MRENISVTFGLFPFLAAFLSYATNHSILWAIFHFMCGGIYIAYWLVFHLKDFLR